MSNGLRESITPFADLLPDSVFLVDAYGRIAYFSAACEAIFGYMPRELI